MSARKVRWAANLPDGTPIILNGVVANVDEAGNLSLDARTAEVVKEVLDHGPETATMVIVPMADFAEEVHRVIEDRHRTELPAVKVTSPTVPVKEHESTLEDIVQETIDLTLRLMYSQMHRYSVKTFGKHPPTVSVDALRNGPLGKNLQLLGKMARGTEERSTGEVLHVVDSVLELLFWPAGEDVYQVPRSFWQEPLGIMFSTAIISTLDKSDVMSVSEAALSLEVTPQLVNRWADERIVRTVHDPVNGRLLVLRRDVEKLLEEANLLRENFLHSHSNEEEGNEKVIVLREPRQDKKRRWEEEKAVLLG